MSSETEQVWARTLRKLHPIFPSELDAASKPLPLEEIIDVPVGVNSTFGSEVEVAPPAPLKFMDVHAIQHDLTGIFGSLEQIEINMITFYEGGYVNSSSEFYTGPTSVILGPFTTQIGNLHNGFRVLKLRFRARSQLSSTQVTVSVGVNYTAYG